jgi:transposase
VERYLRALSEPEAIEVVSIDPYEAYRQAIRAVLPEARMVVDHFHPRARRQHRARLRPMKIGYAGARYAAGATRLSMRPIATSP